MIDPTGKRMMRDVYDQDADSYCRDCRTKHGPWGHLAFDAMEELRSIARNDPEPDFQAWEIELQAEPGIRYWEGE